MPMTLESLMDTYGYLAILVGTFLEGETILVLGAIAAYGGYLSLPLVMLAAFIGSLCGDQLFFFLGRRHGQKFLARRHTWKSRVERAQKLLARYQTPLILVFRFLYGLRTVAPFAIGMSSVPSIRFILLNAVGAMGWAVAVGGGGYLFGSALEIVLSEFKHYEIEVLGAVAFTGGILWAYYFYRRRKNRIRVQQALRDRS
ncbi:MAG: DedA family protein [Pseudomonadota bacterium]